MITVIVADDHRVVCESIQKALDAEKDIKCLGISTNGKEAVEMVRKLRPNVAIIDINMPEMDGIEATKQIKGEFPDVAVLILTAYDYQRYIVTSLEAGADGYLLKAKMPCEALINSVRMAHIGAGTFDIDSVIPLMRFMATKRNIVYTGKAGLSQREREVLSLAANGRKSKDIANVLNISELTVNTYFSAIFKKLGAQSRIEAVMLALKKGWISDVRANDQGS
jgi:DNA-binding NarL/FixJ family response regulator